MKILRKIQNLDIKTFIYKCIFLQFYHFWLSYEIEYEPKQRSVSKECIGNSSLSPDETLHSIGLNGWFCGKSRTRDMQYMVVTHHSNTLMRINPGVQGLDPLSYCDVEPPILVIV